MSSPASQTTSDPTSEVILGGNFIKTNNFNLSTVDYFFAHFSLDLRLLRLFEIPASDTINV